MGASFSIHFFFTGATQAAGWSFYYAKETAVNYVPSLRTFERINLISLVDLMDTKSRASKNGEHSRAQGNIYKISQMK